MGQLLLGINKSHHCVMIKVRPAGNWEALQPGQMPDFSSFHFVHPLLAQAVAVLDADIARIAHILVSAHRISKLPLIQRVIHQLELATTRGIICSLAEQSDSDHAVALQSALRCPP